MIFSQFISLMQAATPTAVFTKNRRWYFMLEENQCYWGSTSRTAQEKILPPLMHQHEKTGISGLFSLKRFQVLPWAYTIPYQNGTEPQIRISRFQALVFTALIIIYKNRYTIFEFICRFFWMYMQWLEERISIWEGLERNTISSF